MRVFGAIVEALVLAMLDIRHDLAPGGAVGAEFVGDHALGRTTLLAQKPIQQSFGCPRIATDLNDFVQHISVLINGAPQIALFAVDRDDHFVEISNVSTAWRLSLQTPGIIRSKFLSPDSNRLVGNHDPAFEQQFLDQPQAERKSKIQPHRMGDDLWRKTVALIAGRGLGHLPHIAQNCLKRS